MGEHWIHCVGGRRPRLHGDKFWRNSRIMTSTHICCRPLRSIPLRTSTCDGATNNKTHTCICQSEIEECSIEMESVIGEQHNGLRRVYGRKLNKLQLPGDDDSYCTRVNLRARLIAYLK
ncbi:hypothetical protein TNCT_663231 [Trichonephila clavata]|uniref:Uncharacterized protein n=1 Tax=Trichonephila clavata TaxID=2740835 RepID=A0A8X6KP91_TRICU|nr:hypothetical protein TNCT_663231 [Trichonephila clavata]